MKRYIAIIFLLVTLSCFGQSPEEDEVIYNQAIDWLNSKLNYIYYDDVGEKWWNNTFYVNEKKIITIKHIASKRPNTANISNKDYTIRSFKIQDINPKSLKITTVKDSRGRIVKGKMLELRTFGFQDLMHKTINNRRGSSTSFLFLSFPEVLNDTLANYAEVVKEKFEQAILASTRLYPNGDDSDKEIIFNVLEGKYATESDQSWNAEQVKEGVLKIEWDTNLIQYFGFNQAENKFYLLNISSEGIQTKLLRLTREGSLSLDEEENKVFIFHSPNSFTFQGQQFFRQ